MGKAQPEVEYAYLVRESAEYNVEKPVEMKDLIGGQAPEKQYAHKIVLSYVKKDADKNILGYEDVTHFTDYTGNMDTVTDDNAKIIASAKVKWVLEDKKNISGYQA